MDADFLNSLVMSNGVVMERDVVYKGVEYVAVLEYNIVHNHKILTYDIKIGGRSYSQETDFAEALKVFNEL